MGAEHGREVQGAITGRGEILQRRGLGPAAELLRPARRGRREWDLPLAVPENHLHLAVEPHLAVGRAVTVARCAEQLDSGGGPTTGRPRSCPRASPPSGSGLGGRRWSRPPARGARWTHASPKENATTNVNVIHPCTSINQGCETNGAAFIFHALCIVSLNLNG